MPGSTAQTRLLLPPAFELHRTDNHDVLAEGVRVAPEKGAGTLVLHQSPGVLGIGVVLEPEQPLAEARQAFILGMTALADALAVHCPPERSVRLVWPDQVLFDTARIGGGRFAVAPGCGEDQVPDWMVFCAELIADRDQLDDPGNFPQSTSLKEEAFDPAEQIVATFASYLLLYFDRWKHEGFSAVSSRYHARIEPPVSGEMSPLALSEALAVQDWRDASGPRL